MDIYSTQLFGCYSNNKIYSIISKITGKMEKELEATKKLLNAAKEYEEVLGNDFMVIGSLVTIAPVEIKDISYFEPMLSELGLIWIHTNLSQTKYIKSKTGDKALASIIF